MNDIGLLILRVVPASFMLFSHGLGKLMGFSQMMNSFPDPIGLGSSVALSLAVFAEFFCCIFLILGVATRLASVPLVITMVVAAAVIHASDPWGKKEFPLLYGVCFLVLIFTGGGKYGVGNYIKASWLKS